MQRYDSCTLSSPRVEFIFDHSPSLKTDITSVPPIHGPQALPFLWGSVTQPEKLLTLEQLLKLPDARIRIQKGPSRLGNS